MNEMMNRFDALYEKMSQSADVKDMKLFGKVMREAMVLIARHMPEDAAELLEKLEAINYSNYLSMGEAEKIIASMEPSPRWNMEQMRRALSQNGYPLEEKPCYNEYALYVTIAMRVSDSKDTLQKYAGATEESKMFELCYHLALDALKDKDKMFNVRDYFKL